MRIFNPVKIFVLLSLLIALSEYVIMSGLAFFDLPPFIAIVVDSLLLIVLLFPVLYLFAYRPLRENIASLHAAKEKIESSHNRLLAVLNSIDAIVYVADMESYEVLFINNYMKGIFGDITGRICWQAIQTGQTGPCPFCTNDKLVGPDGKALPMYRWEFQNTINGHWYDIHDRAIPWIDDRLVRLEIATDITLRKASEEKIQQQNRFLESVIESLPYPFYVVNTATYEIELANTIAASSNITPGKKCFVATHARSTPCSSQAHECPLNLVMDKREPVIVEHVHTTDEGQEEYVEIHAYPIADRDGAITRIIEYQIDITGRKKAEEQLQQLSLTDEMTGLYNRRGFLLLAEKQLQIADRIPGDLFVLYADCDRLKWVNDNMGHKAGDQLITETARLLRNTFRKADIIGRLGGDEFVVLLVDESGKESEASIKSRLDEAINNLGQQPDRHYPFSISYGIIRYDRHNPCSLEKLLTRADRLMYRDKAAKHARQAAS